MTFEQYQALTCHQKSEVLWLDGIYLELIRNTPSLNIELYGLFNFYVEIYYNRQTDEALFIKAFKHTAGLNPYLSQIPIEDIFESNRG